ncbi:MAG: glycerophosphodiester phosphodiesterase family protein [Solirubrobacteraceae bacterium]|nr:glycerophosphodiester phosphodiesterase family protein [Solirubrobacteraceae bacterium]
MSQTSRALAALTAVAAALALAPASANAALPRSADALLPYPGEEITLINHRGLSPGFPENTLAAFRNSVALGVDAIEIDMRATKDGEIVIMHDTTVDRTTDGTGAVSDLTLEQIKALDAGGGERVPTYEESLEAVKGTGVRLLLDIKTAAVTERAVRLTEEHDMVDQVVVGPRTVANLQAFKALNPDLTTLGFIATPADATPMIEAGVDYIRLWPYWILPSRDDEACKADYAARVAAFERGERDHPGSASCIVQDVVDQGTPVWSTVNDLNYEGMDELLQLGATGLLSDLPAEMDRLLDDIDAKRMASATAQVGALAAAVRPAASPQRLVSRQLALLGRLLRDPGAASAINAELKALSRDYARAASAQGALTRVARQLGRGDVDGACAGLAVVADRLEGVADHGWEAREIRRTLACAAA